MVRTALIPLVALGLGGACVAASDSPTLTGVFDDAAGAIEADPPSGETLQLDLAAPCATLDSFALDDQSVELVGSASALFGPVGRRYQCAWSGDVDGPANVRFEVVFIDRVEDFDDYVSLVEGRAGNEIITTDLGQVSVASFTPDAGGLPVTTSILVDADRRAAIQLVVELVDPALREQWTSNDHAELLSSLGQ